MVGNLSCLLYSSPGVAKGFAIQFSNSVSSIAFATLTTKVSTAISWYTNILTRNAAYYCDISIILANVLANAPMFSAFLGFCHDVSIALPRQRHYSLDVCAISIPY